MAVNPEGERPIIEIDAVEYEAAQRDPRVQELLRSAQAYGEQLQAEGRIHTGTEDIPPEVIEDSKVPE
jgi:hypothetical protein